MKSSFDLNSILKNLKISAEWIGLREVRQTDFFRSVRNGLPENNGASFHHGVMVEVLVEGQIGYAATNHLIPEGIERAAEQAFAQARAASRYPAARFQYKDARPASRGHYLSPRKTPLDSASEGELIDILVKINNELRVNESIVSAHVDATISDVVHKYVSSSGANIEQAFLLSTLGMSAVAQDGTNSQTRSDHGEHSRCYQAGLEFITDPILMERAQQIGHQALELLTADDCPAGKMDLLLMPDQMMLQIHESIGHPLELDRILGDERNYAGFSFVRPKDFGQLQYGSKLLNVTFDPTVNGEFASYAFDDAGLPASREFLIEGGRLVRGLGGKESQLRSGIPGVANFRASSWNRAPIDRMANINLEPGVSSIDEMIGNIEYGVLMEANRSWSIDDYRNKFQFGCEYGQLIKNGKISETVKNPNYRGVTTLFWNSLSMVGNAASFEIYGTPYCGKGEPNQIIRVGHGSPACLFKDIEVFGGHS
jgi:predicted Zn-dependent protease